MNYLFCPLKSQAKNINLILFFFYRVHTDLKIAIGMLRKQSEASFPGFSMQQLSLGTRVIRLYYNSPGYNHYQSE